MTLQKTCKREVASESFSLYDAVKHAKWWLFLLRFSVNFQKVLEYVADEGAALQ